jgi:hypothetical protein
MLNSLRYIVKKGPSFRSTASTSTVMSSNASIDPECDASSITVDEGDLPIEERWGSGQRSVKSIESLSGGGQSKHGSCSFPTFDKAFKLNCNLRSEALLILEEAITQESLRFVAKKRNLVQATTTAIARADSKTSTGAELSLKIAKQAVGELMCCTRMLRRLNKYKVSLKKSAFTPRQYKMIAIKIKERKIVAQGSFIDSDADEEDEIVCLLSQFNRAIQEETVVESQVASYQELVHQLEKFSLVRISLVRSECNSYQDKW